MTCFWLVVLWFGAWALAFATIYLWRFAERVSSPIEISHTPSSQEIDAQRQETLQREQQADAANRRRAEARASCELAFATHAAAIKERFTKAMLDDFMARYMGNDHPPEQVESRAEQLRSMIQQHAVKIEEPQKKKSLTDLAAWYLDSRNQIEATDLSRDAKDDLLAQLEHRYAMLQEKYLRGVEP